MGPWQINLHGQYIYIDFTKRALLNNSHKNDQHKLDHFQLIDFFSHECRNQAYFYLMWTIQNENRILNESFFTFLVVIFSVVTLKINFYTCNSSTKIFNKSITINYIN